VTLWCDATSGKASPSKTWAMALGGAEKRATVRATGSAQAGLLASATWLEDGDQVVLVGHVLAQGMSDAIAPGDGLAEKLKAVVGKWKRHNLTPRGRVYVANSELLGRVWYFASIVDLDAATTKAIKDIVEAFVVHNDTRPQSEIFWSVRKAWYEAPHGEGGLGLLPFTEQVEALRCRLVQRLLKGEEAPWRPLAAHWFQKASEPWGLGLQAFTSPSFTRRLQNMQRRVSSAASSLPSHWLKMLGAWQKLQAGLEVEGDGAGCFLEAAGQAVFYNQRVTNVAGQPLCGAAAGGASWRRAAEAGLRTVEDVRRIIERGFSTGRDTLRPRWLWLRATELRRLLPPLWSAEGTRREDHAHLTTAPGEVLPALVTEAGWQMEKQSGPQWVCATGANSRELRLRLWSRRVEERGSNRISTNLNNFPRPTCWTERFAWNVQLEPCLQACCTQTAPQEARGEHVAGAARHLYVPEADWTETSPELPVLWPRADGHGARAGVSTPPGRCQVVLGESRGTGRGATVPF
jgi:hypothetical protein